MRLHYGVDADLEDQADRMLAASVKGIGRNANDILTRWKDWDRRSHELLYHDLDLARPGLIGRAYNPLAGHHVPPRGSLE